MISILRKPKSIKTVYLYLIFGNTLAASFIWGINTIFLLDAGLTNFQAFLMNALFTAGQVVFEIPTGVFADTVGRRASYLVGTITLSVSTFLYLVMWQIQGPLWGWAITSILLGLGFTFFSGALEAWLVDALKATNFQGSIDDVFSSAQITGGVAMLSGSVLGGVIAQFTSLGVPYILRSGILLLNFFVAFLLMKDLGFTPAPADKPLSQMKQIFENSVDHGIKNPNVRWIMLAAPFTAGVSFYIFYALQPFLLELYGNKEAYSIAGVVAALVAIAQIAGGFAVPRIRKFFSLRTNALFFGTLLGAVTLVLVSLMDNFYAATALVFVWGLMFAAMTPIRQAYINGIIPSQQRATILSFDSLMGSGGGIFTQPVLGKVADVYSYATSYAAASVFQFLALPFILLAKNRKVPSDVIEKN